MAVCSAAVGSAARPFARRIAPARARSPVGQMSGPAEGHQQVDVGGPSTDPEHAGQSGVGLVVVGGGDGVEVEPALEHVAAPDRLR